MAGEEMFNESSGLGAIASWYGEQTGLGVDARAAARLIKIQTYLSEHGRTLDQVLLVSNQDRAWNTRKNRAPHEKGAVCIGNTGKASGLTYWWILSKPPKAKRKRAPKA